MDTPCPDLDLTRRDVEFSGPPVASVQFTLFSFLIVFLFLGIFGRAFSHHEEGESASPNDGQDIEAQGSPVGHCQLRPLRRTASGPKLHRSRLGVGVYTGCHHPSGED